jgi:dTDP-4-amino-4,6-dideoxygalactose transaminase
MAAVIETGNTIGFAHPYISKDAREAATRVLESGWVTLGPQVERFEEEFAAFVGAPHAVATSSCTIALELSLMALRLPAGSRVLISTMTFCGAVNAIVHAGLRPVLVDVDEETLTPTASLIRAAVERAGPAQAMIVLHFGGDPAPVEELAVAAGLPLERIVEDAAHAVGSWVGDRPVGSISGATCFSFYATKNLPIGEGGMITTPDPATARFLATARLHGMSRDAWRRYLPGAGWAYDVELIGLKGNMTDLQAAIGLGQLRHLPAWQDRRAELAARYDRNLGEFEGIRLPSRSGNGRHAWHLYVVQVEGSFGSDRDALIRRLSERGIECSVHFIPTHHQPAYRDLADETGGGFPGADAASSRILSLPLYPTLSDEDVDRVCDEIADLGGMPSHKMASGSA